MVESLSLEVLENHADVGGGMWARWGQAGVGQMNLLVVFPTSVVLGKCTCSAY